MKVVVIVLFIFHTAISWADPTVIGDRTIYYFGGEKVHLICRSQMICTIELEAGEEIIYPPAVGNQSLWEVWVIPA